MKEPEYSIPLPENDLGKMSRKSRLTLLAAVLSLLVAGAFVGAYQYKKSAERVGCVVNISAMQKAMRATVGVHNMNSVSPSDVIGPGKFQEEMLECPSGGTYSFTETIPKVGVAYMRCSCEDHNPAPSETKGW